MLHSWNLSPEQAIALQNQLRDRLVLKWDNRPVHTIGGIDVSVKEELARAVIVVLRYRIARLFSLHPRPAQLSRIAGHSRRVGATVAKARCGHG